MSDSGAPAALQFIEQDELRYRQQYELARQVLEKCLKLQLEKPDKLVEIGTDFDEDVKIADIQFASARERWQSSLKVLREFDKQVSPEKRDSSEKITRNEGEGLLKLVIIYFRTGVETFIGDFCTSVLGVESMRGKDYKEGDIYKLAADRIRSAMRNAVDSGVRETHLPGWVKTAMEAMI